MFEQVAAKDRYADKADVQHHRKVDDLEIGFKNLKEAGLGIGKSKQNSCPAQAKFF
ncbi:hypothetical protein [Ruegeria atlantica]|uniref:hypothetical protein n=1 Tax=Ruegeria atlantica TaxID=81569 RepID=UPI00147DD160|nr:hypothetical protein [Ruegeria atlantica]